MRKSQFVSPIIILAVIIISTLIISVQARIETEQQARTTDYVNITNNIILSTNEDLNYQKELTQEVLKLASTINSSGTLISILTREHELNLRFTHEILIEYNKSYEINGTIRVINNTIIIPYPYNKLVSEEQRFNPVEFRNCMGTTCSSLEACTNAYDSGTIDWEPILCLTNPLRVRITVIDAEYSLTSDYPYNLFNDSLINID